MCIKKCHFRDLRKKLKMDTMWVQEPKRRLGVAMISNKEKVMKFIQMYSSDEKHDEFPKITTKFLSEKLNLQRTNLSTILNQLVKEGRLVKYSGRPVLYQMAEEAEGQKDVFTEIIGFDGSLKEAVATAKAAVLYPERNCNILLSGHQGSGIHYFAKKVFQFAVKAGILKSHALFYEADCKSLQEGTESIREIFLGNQGTPGLLEKVDGGMLLLKHAQMLSAYNRSILFSILNEERKGTAGNSKKAKKTGCSIIYSVDDENSGEALEFYKNHLQFRIWLPPLNKRPLKERFALIEKFLKKEAEKIKRMIEADTSILHALMLYDVPEDLRGLRNDIHAGCANSYVRSYQNKNRTIQLQMSDFPNYVRKGILYYKTYKEEIDLLILTDCRYTFSAAQMLKDNKSRKQDIYQFMDTRKRELRRQEMTEEEIDIVISAELKAEFQKYSQQLYDRVTDKNIFEKMVSEKLRQLVQRFCQKAENELGIKIEERTYFEICLHLNGCLVKTGTKQRISNTEISRLIGQYPMYYQLAKDLNEDLKSEFRSALDADEIVFLMLFLLQGREEKEEHQVVTLIAMHGSHLASSITEVVNIMADAQNTYAYDLALDKHIHTAYEELKQKIIQIHQGKGIILIYDMGSIRTMAESIVQETGIRIKCIEMPVTLLGIASSSFAAKNASLDEVVEYLQSNFHNIQYFREKQGEKQHLLLISDHQDLIAEAKTTLKDQLGWKGEINTIEKLDMNYLYNEIDRISQKGKIIGIIGEEDPGLKQYPFSYIQNLTQTNAENLEEFFQEVEEDGIEETFDYLEDQFNQLDMQKMRTYLLPLLDQLGALMKIEMDEDKKIGLIVHMVCLIDRLLHHPGPAVNFMASNILVTQGKLVEEVKQLLVPLEKAFHVTISEIEIAIVISIIEKN